MNAVYPKWEDPPEIEAMVERFRIALRAELHLKWMISDRLDGALCWRHDEHPGGIFAHECGCTGPQCQWCGERGSDVTLPDRTCEGCYPMYVGPLEGQVEHEIDKRIRPIWNPKP